jgi:Cu(I)/Ag(I) efflux system membrane fusion protein
MNVNFQHRDHLLLRSLTLFMAIFLVIIGLTILLSSCKEEKKNSVPVAKKDVYYTCSMHPQIHEDHPGDCPICGMSLIAVSKTGTNATTGVHLNPEQIRLGNIHADTVGIASIGDNLILAGTLNFNQNKLSSISARVEGRIDKLYFKNIGDYIQKADKLYDLYSEQLNNAKQEYINAMQQQNSIGTTLINYGALVESAKNKLILWGMTNSQIKQLAQTKEASPLTSFFSTEAGYVTTMNAKEGDYVMEGGPVIELANLSTLWAEAQVYTTQMTSINKGETGAVQIPDMNQTIPGTIDFVNPEINPDARINLLRITIQNKNNQLHPGMQVNIIINNKQHNSITLPADAVLRDSKGAIVWLQTDSGNYEIKMVQVGIVSGNTIEIKSGLKAGDVVVTSGAYLLNSEYIFEHGADPMAEMDMSKTKM